MELFFYLFSFDATVDYHDASCGEKLHGVVLIYRLISRQLQMAKASKSVEVGKKKPETKAYTKKTTTTITTKNNKREWRTNKEKVTTCKTLQENYKEKNTQQSRKHCFIVL